MQAIKKITAIGGGTGTSNLVAGLKKYDVDISVVVGISDDGGSTGILRDELGVLPPGDIRQCMVALAECDDVMRKAFNYRFTGDGALHGHNLGNIILSAFEKMYGNPISGINALHHLLKVKGRVIPVSAQCSRLYAELTDGKVLESEHAIDQTAVGRAGIAACFLDPVVMANPDALAAIRNADAIVLGPGDIFTSLVPVLLVEGMADAIAASTGRRIFVINLVNKRGHTDGFTARSYIDALSPYIINAKIDAVIINNASIPSSVSERYLNAGEQIVVDDMVQTPGLNIVRADLLSRRPVRPIPGDMVARSLLRHDPERLAQAILSLL